MWIAFIFQYLWDTKQLWEKSKGVKDSCELLSFFSIFGIQNNAKRCTRSGFSVVNCFHFSVSLGYKTTIMGTVPWIVQLWIAFIFQYLWDTKQHALIIIGLPACCELLSFFSIFGIQNNLSKQRKQDSAVVNCFHFSVSLGYKTTVYIPLNINLELWIAFIFQYLWDTKQPWVFIRHSCISCELLSFFSIFGIQNNATATQTREFSVVNCFHFSVSLGYKTTAL